MICEQYKETGIHIVQQYICLECEERIVGCEPTDPFYQHYLAQLRKLNLVHISS
ncbi:sigma factor G inhibitor Gin [Fictibacillus macauensis]|nr:sigma factor G inhibitor Gin [Fictibacillus macauensis]